MRLLAAIALACICAVANAQSATVTLNIKAQPIREALREFGEQTQLQILFRSEGLSLDSITTQPLSGELSLQVALDRLLANTGLQYEFINERTVRISAIPVPEQKPQASDAHVLEEIVVTGTHIGGAGPVGASLVRLERTQLDRQGFGTVQEALRSLLPQNVSVGPAEAYTNNLSSSGTQNADSNRGGGAGVNIRGLGSDSTLLLVDGRRVAPSGSGTFADVSQIPIGAIERVEVLTDGASALYGSDAVAGVVNVILRRDFQGFETRGRLESADGFTGEQFAQLGGLNWSSGSLLAGYQYQHRDALSAADRPYITSDLRAFGGGDYRSNFGSPGNLVVNGISYALPSNQPGTGINPSVLKAGTQNLSDPLLGARDLLKSTEQHNGFIHLTQDVGESLGLFADALYGSRQIAGNENPVTVTLTVPRANPWFVTPVPAAQSVQVRASLVNELGPIVGRARSDFLSLAGGVKATLGESWRGEVSLAHSSVETNYRTSGNANTFYLNQAVVSSNPALAFNPFGDGGGNSASVLDRIRGFTRIDDESRLNAVYLRANGDLFELPAGMLKMAVGAEGSREDLSTLTTTFTSTAEPSTTQVAPLDLDRSSWAAYVELRVPLIRTLDLSVAGRTERYSDFGRTTNPKIALDWQPVTGLTLQGSYGTSFKAPLLTDLNGASQRFQFASVTDPSIGGNSNAIVLSGGNPNLVPERARHVSWGFKLEPQSVPGLTLGATHFDIDYDDRVANILTFRILSDPVTYQDLFMRSPTTAQVLELMNDPRYVGSVVDPASVALIVDTRRRNLSAFEVSGIDYEMSYSMQTTVGKFTFGLNGSSLLDYKSAVTEKQALTERVGTVHNPAHFRGRASIDWAWQEIAVGLYANHVGGSINRLATTTQNVESWTTADVSVSYRSATLGPGVLSGLSLALTASNLTDSRPPFVDSPYGGIDSVNGSFLGRVVALQVTKLW